jgi:protein-disulfide isomerase
VIGTPHRDCNEAVTGRKIILKEHIMRKLLLAVSVGSAILAGSTIVGSIQAQEQNATPSDLTRSQVETIVRNYLLTNPEILLEVQSALEAKMQAEQAAQSQRVIAGAADQLFNSPHDGIVGNPDGSVTVVEFFDYNCGYCKRALGDMDALVADDGDLRFVLKEFPILGPESHQAHVVSMAFRNLAPEKYGEFHRRLLGSQGRANEESAIRLAVELGVDEAALREEMKNPQIEAAFNETYQLASRLQITGTPSYVVGSEIVFGALGRDHLSEKIKAVRQ